MNEEAGQILATLPADLEFLKAWNLLRAHEQGAVFTCRVRGTDSVQAVKAAIQKAQSFKARVKKKKMDAVTSLTEKALRAKLTKDGGPVPAKTFNKTKMLNAYAQHLGETYIKWSMQDE